MTIQQQQRLDRIVKLLDTGRYTLREVGETFGISRQRVSQIYILERGRRYELLRKAWKEAHPRVCVACELRKATYKELCGACYERMRYNSDEEIRIRNIQRMRKWQEEHPERTREMNRKAIRRYYQRHKDRVVRSQRAYVQKNRERINAYQIAYRREKAVKSQM